MSLSSFVLGPVNSLPGSASEGTYAVNRIAILVY
jgi:hypothetical protein